ncbi:MAG TPA: hypothetical protein VN706_10460 [Gemmatimonadaceae bacterium]|nr:hypothetical protein [Gemmatimonadaceae bacterium]
MKHKGERQIPDFSKKPKAPQTPRGVTPERNAQQSAKPARTPQPKPHSTSSKSGRRGS